MNFDVQKVREQFPIISNKIYNKPLIYFDNGATTQKPQVVISRISEMYSKYNANIHRGVHYLSEYCTSAYEEARLNVMKFINAESIENIIFTKGTTDSINLVAWSFGEAFINSGDEIIVSAMEHHSNIVPWQMLCDRKNASLKVIPINLDGELIIDEFASLINKNTKLISITAVSNALGTINPIKEIIELAHKKGIYVMIDGAQAIQHIKVDVKYLDADFYAFSGHKVYGPTGIGVLYGKKELLEKMPPYQGGGDMIEKVTFEKTTYNHLPFKFEAGTANYIDAIALSDAINFINNLGIENIAEYEQELLNYATNRIMEIEGIKIIGTAKNKCSVLSFLIDRIHPYDAGTLLDKMGIAVRTGTHCAQPLMDFFGISGTIRASFAMYNTKDEIDHLIASIKKVKEMML